MSAQTVPLAELPENEQLAIVADVADMDGNARVVKQPPVVAIPTKPHPCRVCGVVIPRGEACASWSLLTRHRKWTWHYHLACSPVAARPLPERRALRFLSRAFNQRSLCSVPDAAWRVLADLRNADTPF